MMDDELIFEHDKGAMRALDKHLAHWEWTSPPGRLEREYRFLLDASFRDAVGYINDPHRYADEERRFLNEAKTCYISQHMMDVALYAAGIEFTRSDAPLGERYAANGHRVDPKLYNRDGWLQGMSLHLDDTRVPTLRPEMLPTKEGLLFLERGFWFPDYDLNVVNENGQEGLGFTKVVAIGWKEMDDISSSSKGLAPGVVLYIYVDPHPQVGDYYRERYGSIPPMSMIDFSGWSYDIEFGIGGWEFQKVLDESIVRPHIASVRMFMAAVWGLMGQYVTSNRPTRQQMKKAKRLKMAEDGDVTVIHLRKFLQTIRHHTEPDEDAWHRWTHRWLVRPHWAWRHCKCDGHEGRHRVYIEGYIKGPEHLPLVIKDRIISLDR